LPSTTYAAHLSQDQIVEGLSKNQRKAWKMIAATSKRQRLEFSFGDFIESAHAYEEI
jgi:hypothetical protein